MGLLFMFAELGELAGEVLEISLFWWLWEKAGELTNPLTLPDPEKRLSYPNPTFTSSSILEYVKGPDLQIQTNKIPVTQNNNGISRKRPREGAVWVE